MPNFKIKALFVQDTILKVLTIYGRIGHLGHVIWTMYTTFPPPSHAGSKRNLALIGKAVSEKIFENDGQMDDGRTPDHGYTINSPGEPTAQVSK